MKELVKSRELFKGERKVTPLRLTFGDVAKSTEKSRGVRAENQDEPREISIFVSKMAHKDFGERKNLATKAPILNIYCC